MFEDIRQIPLVEVLKSFGFTEWKQRANGERYGACPIHKGKNKTCFSFTNTKYHCFSCNAKGSGSIDLVKALKGCSFKEAVDWLSTLDTKPEIQPHIVETKDVTENLPYKASYEKYYVKSEWLEKRGLTQETLKLYGVGEYNNPARKSQYTGQIMFPIRRFSDGACVGYLVRNPNPTPERPKYLFPKGVAKHLEVFGSHELKTSQLPLRVGYLVESPFCVMKFHQLGFPAVSCYGWSISPQQLQILSQLFRGVIYLPDLNVRENATKQLHLLASRIWVKCPEFPAPDPEYLTLEQIQALSR